MPLYTYRCNNCNHEFETRQRMADDPLKDCPVCDGEVRRVVNSVGIVFKGSGFYVTDNRGGKAKSSTVSSQRDDTSADTPANGSAKTVAGSDDSSKPAKETPAPKKSDGQQTATAS